MAGSRPSSPSPSISKPHDHGVGARLGNFRRLLTSTLRKDSPELPAAATKSAFVIARSVIQAYGDSKFVSGLEEQRIENSQALVDVRQQLDGTAATPSSPIHHTLLHPSDQNNIIAGPNQFPSGGAPTTGATTPASEFPSGAVRPDELPAEKRPYFLWHCDVGERTPSSSSHDFSPEEPLGDQPTFVPANTPEPSPSDITDMFGCADMTRQKLEIGWEPWPSNNGGFANIYKGTLNEEFIALKQLKPVSKGHNNSQRFRKEVQVWSRLKNSNILPFLGVCCGLNGTMYMCSPWCENGDLNYYLEYVNVHANRILLLYQIAAGLAYLHGLDIVHGDLRGANIVISAEGDALLSDFGLSKLLVDVTAIETSDALINAGATRWMAPELFGKNKDTRVTKEADIYAYGITAIEMYTNVPPYAPLSNPISLVLDIMNGHRPQRPSGDPPSHCVSDSLWELMRACWNGAPDLRPEIVEVRNLIEQEQAKT